MRVNEKEKGKITRYNINDVSESAKNMNLALSTIKDYFSGEYTHKEAMTFAREYIAKSKEFVVKAGIKDLTYEILDNLIRELEKGTSGRDEK